MNVMLLWGNYVPPIKLQWGTLANSTPQTPNPENPIQPVAVLVATAGSAVWANTEW